MLKRYLLFSSVVLMLHGCVSSGNKPDAAEPGQRCLVSDPKDVHLWINAMPGPGVGRKYPLLASFTVTAPTPGYQFILKVDRVMESAPEQVVLDLIATPPSGMVAQVLTDTKVNTTLANFPGSEGSAIQVNCGGKPFFKVTQVMAVH